MVYIFLEFSPLIINEYKSTENIQKSVSRREKRRSNA